jgi:hypothetical protein
MFFLFLLAGGEWEWVSACEWVSEWVLLLASCWHLISVSRLTSSHFTLHSSLLSPVQSSTKSLRWAEEKQSCSVVVVSTGHGSTHALTHSLTHSLTPSPSTSSSSSSLTLPYTMYTTGPYCIIYTNTTQHYVWVDKALLLSLHSAHGNQYAGLHRASSATPLLVHHLLLLH